MAVLGLSWADKLLAEPFLKNPCLDAGEIPSDSPWLRHIWDDLNPEEVRDSHCHLAGLGDSHGAAASGIVLGKAMDQACPSSLAVYMRRRFIMNSSCAETPESRVQGLFVDEAYVFRLTADF